MRRTYARRRALLGESLGRHGLAGRAAGLDAGLHLVVDLPTPRAAREVASATRPEGPLGYDWEVVPAIIGQLADPDPDWWGRLELITAPTLIIGGGRPATSRRTFSTRPRGGSRTASW
jgi:pimeloyl-ACP methyl ester carboxylesterase